jgi:hypothetical protein
MLVRTCEICVYANPKDIDVNKNVWCTLSNFICCKIQSSKRWLIGLLLHILDKLLRRWLGVFESVLDYVQAAKTL